MATELPMPEPTVPRRPLTSYKALSFDIYGTLIDWERGMIEHIAPILQNTRYASAPKDAAVAAEVSAMFHEIESRLNSKYPTKLYSQILTETYLAMAEELGFAASQEDAAKFGGSVGSWPAFPDTVDAMIRLGKHFKLIPLSNVDRQSFENTCRGSLDGVKFWRSYVASEIGSYKPELRNFEYLREHMGKDSKAEGEDGLRMEDDLHVAQSLTHDHVPCREMGWASVWIARKGAGYGVSKARKLHETGAVGYGWRFATLGQFADEVERQFAEK